MASRMGWAKLVIHSGCGVEVAVGIGVEVGRSVGVSVGTKVALGAMDGDADGTIFVSVGAVVQAAVNIISSTTNRMGSKLNRLFMFILPPEKLSKTSEAVRANRICSRS